MRSRVLIAGGYGVFGKHLARELLATTDAEIVLAGRDLERARSACNELPDPGRSEPMQLDLADPSALAHAVEGCVAVACTAGPFQKLSLALPRAAVEAGVHWLDVSDVPDWVLPILDDAELASAAEVRGLVVMSGLSTVPAVSGLLARRCLEQLPEARRGRVALFIGNRNQKGTGATASALIGGFRDPQPVELPFGRRKAYVFATPDAELFRRELGVEAEFRAALEWGYLGRSTAIIGRVTRWLGPAGQARIARVLSRMSKPFSRFGSELGCVQVELFADDGRSTALTAVAGQRLVILPLAVALRALLDGDLGKRGVLHPAGWLAPGEYLARLQSRGVRVLARGSPG